MASFTGRKKLHMAVRIAPNLLMAITKLTSIFKVHDNLFSSMDPTALRYLNLNGSEWVSCSFPTTFPFIVDLKGAIKDI